MFKIMYSVNYSSILPRVLSHCYDNGLTPSSSLVKDWCRDIILIYSGENKSVIKLKDRGFLKRNKFVVKTKDINKL